VSARRHRCSLAVAEEEEDEVMSEGCSPEHQQWQRGGAMMTKSGGGSSSMRERKRARESSRARGKGAGCYAGWSSPFIVVGGASGRRQQSVTSSVKASMPLMAGRGYKGG
jgi:hypothetical protein